MTSERFNQLLNGPLGHPFVMMRLNRLAIALRVVVDTTGKAGEDALEAHCRERDDKDDDEQEEE
jgi:hypothetical protein